MAIIATANLTANGNTDFEVPLDRNGRVKPFTIFSEGDWGTSGSMTVSYSTDEGTTYMDSGETAITADGFFALAPYGVTHVRIVLASATSPDLNVNVHA